MFMTDCEKEKASGSDLIWIIYYHYLFLSTSHVPLQDDPRFPFLTPVSCPDILSVCHEIQFDLCSINFEYDDIICRLSI